MPLLDRDECVLVVIDAQPSFYPDGALEPADRAAADDALARAAWLAAAAAEMAIPAIVTEEQPDQNGGTHPDVMDALPDTTPVFVKPRFALTGCDDIVAAVQATGRTTAVLVGFETDVCVAQSAVGLVDLGYRVVLAADATYSPGEMHARGISRAVDAGVEINHAKGVFYEWARSVERSVAVAAAVGPAPFRL